MSKPQKLTQLETLIMDIIWRREQATVREVMEALETTKPMAYTTVLTMMRILRDKGFLESVREGKTDVYSAVCSREELGKGGLTDVLGKFFHGSAKALVSQLLESEDVSDEEIREIRKEINKRLKERRDS